MNTLARMEAQGVEPPDDTDPDPWDGSEDDYDETRFHRDDNYTEVDLTMEDNPRHGLALDAVLTLLDDDTSTNTPTPLKPVLADPQAPQKAVEGQEPVYPDAGWFAVSERLPPNSDYVAVYVVDAEGDYYPAIAWHSEETGWSLNGVFPETALFWTPLLPVPTAAQVQTEIDQQAASGG